MDLTRAVDCRDTVFVVDEWLSRPADTKAAREWRTGLPEAMRQGTERGNVFVVLVVQGRPLGRDIQSMVEHVGVVAPFYGVCRAPLVYTTRDAVVAAVRAVM